MRGLEIIVVVLTAVLALTWLARRLPASEPLFLLFGGVLLGLVPSFGEVRLSGEVVLLIFLPPLLYAEALNVSLYQIKANFRVIVLLAVGLVLVTLVTVAATAHAFGLAWAVAFVLGAILSPTDATAVALVARGMPRRFVAMCRRRAWSTTVPRWWPMPWPSTSRSAACAFTWGDAVGRDHTGDGRMRGRHRPTGPLLPPRRSRVVPEAVPAHAKAQPLPGARNRAYCFPAPAPAS